MRICQGGGVCFRVLQVFSIAGGEKIGSELMKNSGKNLMRRSLSSRSEPGKSKIAYDGIREGIAEKNRSYWKVMK
jgi:hypothetical protein